MPWVCPGSVGLQQPGHTTEIPHSHQTLSKMQQQLQTDWSKVGDLWGKPICLLSKTQGLPPISHFPLLPLSFGISGTATPVFSKGDKGSREKE